MCANARLQKKRNITNAYSLDDDYDYDVNDDPCIAIGRVSKDGIVCKEKIADREKKKKNVSKIKKL